MKSIYFFVLDDKGGYAGACNSVVLKEASMSFFAWDGLQIPRYSKKREEFILLNLVKIYQSRLSKRVHSNTINK
jgi:hypothetical protein